MTSATAKTKRNNTMIPGRRERRTADMKSKKKKGESKKKKGKSKKKKGKSKKKKGKKRHRTTVKTMTT